MYFYFIPITMHCKYDGIIYHLLHNLFVLNYVTHEHNVGDLVQDCRIWDRSLNFGMDIISHSNYILW